MLHDGPAALAERATARRHPVLLDFNPTLASVLKDAGYATAAVVDNPNVAARYGYAKGFDRYRETWQENGARHARRTRARAITAGGIAFLRDGAGPGGRSSCGCTT